MKTITCRLSQEQGSYDIEIGKGLLNDFSRLNQNLAHLGSRFAIVSDSTVASLYGEELLNRIRSMGLDASLFSFPAGERHKTRKTKEQLEDSLFSSGFGRDTCILALGGGVATDLGGYLAATYCRGVPLVIIPTSLLGMADASIGGKTGVNVPHGKNLVGVIYPPKKIIMDTSTLCTLPIGEVRNGMVEMIKHALIADSELFDLFERNVGPLLNLELDLIEEVIYASSNIKKAIVEEDEKEAGKRRLLNFGHTIGHALESLTEYSLPHGEAVALGIVVESYLSHQLGFLSEGSLNRIFALFQSFGLPMKLPRSLDISSLMNVLVFDKKARGGVPRFVIIDKIGSMQSNGTDYCESVNPQLLEHSLQWMNHDLCCH